MRSDIEGKFLNSLVSDCIIYRLTEAEAMLYIRTRFGEVSLSTYYRRRARIESDKGADNWLNHFTRIGFVKHHRKLMDNIQTILDDSNRRLLLELQRRPPNQELILKIKTDIRESANLLSELGLGTPIVAQIRAKLAEKAEVTTPSHSHSSISKQDEKLV